MWWAENFHWTPEQVDGVNAVRAANLRKVAEALYEGRANANKPKPGA